jgi:hypothetical protein
MTESWKQNHALYLGVIGGLAWLVPGGGHYALGENRRAVIICAGITLTFIAGLYIGSVGVVDPVTAMPWYVAQTMNSPAVFLLGNYTANAHYEAQEQLRRAQNDAQRREAMNRAYLVYGRAGEVGQIYTSIAGLLNLLCIVNAIYMAHLRAVRDTGA